MRRYILLILFITILSTPLFAQLEVKEGSFKEVPGFVNINSNPDYQFDDNDKPFAVIKVRTENITDKQRRQLSFKGNAGTFIMLEYKDGEVWVYLTAQYADYLKISHPDFSSCEYTLPFDLQPKKGYEMTLENKTVAVSSGWASLTIKTKPENGAKILLNGRDLNATTPYTNNMLAAGKYKITVSKHKFETTTQTIDIQDGDNKIIEIEMLYKYGELNVTSESEANVYVDEIDCSVTPAEMTTIVTYGNTAQAPMTKADAENQFNNDNVKKYPIDFSSSSIFDDVKVELSDVVITDNAQQNGLLGIQIEYDLNLIAIYDTVDYVTILRFYLANGTPLMSNNINYSYNGCSAIETIVKKGKSHIKSFIPYVAIQKFNNTGLNKMMNDLFGWHLQYEANILYHNISSNTYTPLFQSKKNGFRIKLPSDYESHYRDYRNVNIPRIPDEIIQQNLETELENTHTDSKYSWIIYILIATVTAIFVWILVRYFKRKEWDPKYRGGKLEIIKRHGKIKVIAHSTKDNDKIIVWNRCDDGIKSAEWHGSVIELYRGLGQCYMLYGPYDFELKY